MQVIWHPSDIRVGRIYGKQGVREKWLIGYRPDVDGPCRFVSISLDDGMVTEPRTDMAMAECLSRHEYLPVELLEAPKVKTTQ